MTFIRFLKYISITKLFNLFKIYFGYVLSKLIKKPFILGSPFSLTIEPTNNCNLSCLECPTGNNESNRKKGVLEFEGYKKIIDETKKYLIYLMLYFQGEPFLNPDIFEMIAYANLNKIYTSISTNGHFLDSDNNSRIVKSGLKKIIVSIDGTTQESYEKYRVGGNFNKVISGVKNLVQLRGKNDSSFPQIIVQFLVLKANEHQIEEIKDLSRTLGADKVELKSAQIEDFNKNLMPTIDKFSRYTKINGNFKIKSKLKNCCFRIWSTLVVTWEGIIVPCCFDKRLQYPLGNVNREDVLKLWKSPLFNQFRKEILLNRKKNTICGNCTEGLRIKN